MKINVSPFGKAFGKSAFLFTLTTSKGASLSVTNAAGAITDIRMPDKKGKLESVALGFSDARQYAKNPGYLGALIGPVGNRIKNAEFDFGGKHYTFKPNEGKTLLHSGDFGFHTRVWDASLECDESAAKVILTQRFEQKDTGFPGDLDAKVTYTLNELNEVRIDYEITSDAPTFVSPTNHTYFNLGGANGKKPPRNDRMKVRVFADRFTAIDEASIPVGVRPVEGTPLDLRDWTRLGDRMDADDEQIKNGTGIDHNFILSSDRDLTGLRPAAEVFDPRSGRAMRVYTDMPSVQLYTGNFLSRRDGEKGVSYGKRRALCLETQCAPDSIHHPGEAGYDIATVDREHPFRSATVYAFSVKNERV